MYFDCQKEEDVKRLLAKIQYLIDKRKRVDIVEKKEKRTLSQNNYLHLILTYFAIEYGEPMEYIKKEYFKELCNPDMFIIPKEDKFKGRTMILRSSSDLDSSEMTTAIDRFKNWSAKEAGIYLPDANDEGFLTHIQTEMLRYKQWT